MDPRNERQPRPDNAGPGGPQLPDVDFSSAEALLIAFQRNPWGSRANSFLEAYIRLMRSRSYFQTYRILRNDADAKEAQLVAFGKMATTPYAPRGKFLAWFDRTCTNAALDALKGRKRRQRKHAELEPRVGEVFYPEQDPEWKEAQLVLGLDIEAWLLRQSMLTRNVFEMALRGLSGAKIAHGLAVDVRKVRKELNYIHKELLRLFEETKNV